VPACPDDPGTSVLQTTGGWALRALVIALGAAATPFLFAFEMVSGILFR
jgi:hypothetical protein